MFVKSTCFKQVCQLLLSPIADVFEIFGEFSRNLEKKSGISGDIFS